MPPPKARQQLLRHGMRPAISDRDRVLPAGDRQSTAGRGASPRQRARPERSASACAEGGTATPSAEQARAVEMHDHRMVAGGP